MVETKFINAAKRTGTTSPAAAPKGTDSGGKPFQVK
jgi:hypothetical protein